MNIAHIAWYTRASGHAGGVPMFGSLLARCLGAREWSWSDYDKPLPRVDEVQAARLLGQWLDDTGRLNGVDVVVADGFWGRGITSVPVVSVAHGTWRGIARALNSPGAERLGWPQAEEYHRRPVVAVSEATAEELRTLYDVEPAAVIGNAVDTDEFCPWPDEVRDKPLVLYPSDAPGKGGDVVAALRVACPEFDFETIGGTIGEEAERISVADLFLAPSRTEGCSYAAIQALACGVPVVASAVGMFALLACPVATVLPPPPLRDLTADEIGTWAEALTQTHAHRAQMGSASRAWAVEHASLPQWTEKWETFLVAQLTKAHARV